MDSIMDVIVATAIRIHMYKVKKPDDEIIKQAEILFRLFKNQRYYSWLRDMKIPKWFWRLREINTLENAGDVVLRTIITNLFIKEQDAIELIKWKEIFERIEEAIDVCEDVSNIVEGIVLKHALSS